jgi:hypothetical protein
MDPAEAITDLISAIKSGDRDTAEMLVDDLIDWVDKDGYLPLIQVDGVMV